MPKKRAREEAELAQGKEKRL